MWHAARAGGGGTPPMCALQVLAEEFKSAVECYATCPGPVPLFNGGLADLTATGPDHAAALLREHGVAVQPVCPTHAATVPHLRRHTSHSGVKLTPVGERAVRRQSRVRAGVDASD